MTRRKLFAGLAAMVAGAAGWVRPARSFIRPGHVTADPTIYETARWARERAAEVNWEQPRGYYLYDLWITSKPFKVGDRLGAWECVRVSEYRPYRYNNVMKVFVEATAE